MGLDVSADVEAKFGGDGIPCTSVGSKTGWTEKGKLPIPKSRGGEDLLSLDKHSLGATLNLCLYSKSQLVVVAALFICGNVYVLIF